MSRISIDLPAHDVHLPYNARNASQGVSKRKYPQGENATLNPNNAADSGPKVEVKSRDRRPSPVSPFAKSDSKVEVQGKAEIGFEYLSQYMILLVA